MAKIVITTAKAWPSISKSDQLYAKALSRYGLTVEGLPWNDTPLAKFTEADAVILRSNWDYHQNLAAFQQWLAALEKSAVPVFNPVALVRWNLDKRYLLDLAAQGFPVPETHLIEDLENISAIFANLNCSHAVIKPAWGASGFGVQLVDASTCQTFAAKIQQAMPDRPLLMQAFVPEISQGEYALVFFNSQFSHAFIRRPADGEYRVNSQYGGQNSAQVTLDPVLVKLAHAIIEALPTNPLYARIDLVLRRDGKAVLMEVEVNEPALGLTFSAHAPTRFAEATQQHLKLLQ